MNCGGPVADDDTHCTTCGLARGSVIYGERPWSGVDSIDGTGLRCAICGGPLDRDCDDDVDLDDEVVDENADICVDCEQDLGQAPVE